MKSSKLVLTSLCIALAGAIAGFCLPAVCQTAGLIPTGNCSLPAGQYMLTNMRTGLAVYMEIDASGRMLAQDPKALQFSVTPLSTGYGFNQGTTAGGALPTDTTNGAAAGQGNSFFGGLMKQGLQQILNKQTAPGQQPASPLGIPLQ